jgi:ATP-dependent Clp endopeptidase proteolytic subunit ClpP
MSKSWYSITASANATEPVEINIYEEIGFWGVTAKSFLDALAVAKGRPITLRINSPGGDVFDGMAIYNRLKAHSHDVTVHIDGLAASMASVIAMAGKTVNIAEGAMMMIHNPSVGYASGESKDLRKTADLLDQAKKATVTAYVRKTGLDETEVNALMDEETWLTAADAKEKGFADVVTDGVKAVALARPFDTFKFRNLPQQLKQQNPQTMFKLTASVAALLATATGLTVTENTSEADVTSALTALTGKLTAATGQVTALTAERDDIKAQFASLTGSVDGIKAQLTTAQGQVTALTTERDGIKAKFETATGNVSRLEQLCAVKGINPNAAPPKIEEPTAQLTEAQWTAKYTAATPREKANVWKAFQAAATAGEVLPG